MKILHYISGISPTIGGIEIFVLNIYQEMKNKGYQIEILTRYVDKTTKMYNMFAEAGIEIHSLEINHLTSHNMMIMKKRVETFFKTNEQFDVLHSHCGEDPFVISAARKYGVRMIALHVHSYRKKIRDVYSYVKTMVINKNCKYADAFFVCSPEVGMEYLPKKYRSKIITINNGIDSKRFEFDNIVREEYRVSLGLDAAAFVICHVGRFDSSKNHSFLIDIFYRVQQLKPESRLLLVGDGLLKESVTLKCKELGIESKVIFTGDRVDVDKLMQAADIFVLPSLNEGFGIVIVEAQAAGLHCIVSSDSVSQTVKVSELVEFMSLNESVSTWTDAILKYTNGYERKKMSEIIKKAGFDKNNCVAHLMQIYDGK